MLTKNRYIAIVCAALFCLSGGLWAQDSLRLANGDIRVEQLRVRKTGDESFTVDCIMQVDDLRLPSNRLMKFTPVIVDGDSALELRPVVVAGRRQYFQFLRRSHRAYRRAGIEPLVVRRTNGKPQTVTYQAVAPYASWMDNAALDIAEDLCGCGGNALDQNMVHLAACDFDRPTHAVSFVPAFVCPAVEAVKHREESGSAYLDFPVNLTTILPDYHDNAAELAKIYRTIDLVKNDAATHVTRISIHGYASPEGSYEGNARLAQRRAEALKEYVRRLYHFEGVAFDVQSTPEDWQGLRRFVAGSDFSAKDELMAIIDSDLDPDVKNWKLQLVDGRKPYDYLLTHVYPRLRHSDYTVEYTVRAFDVEEARRLLKTRPQLLSLNEMYLVAQTYEPGSPEFNEVFDIAVRMFPDDATANLNAANAALLEGDLRRAAAYLQKAGESPEAVHARSALQMLQGMKQANDGKLSSNQ